MKKMITIAVVSLSLISQTVLAESTVGDVEVYNKILQQRLIVNQAKSELDMALSKIKMHEENIASSKSGRKFSAVLVISSAVIMLCIPSTPSSQFPSIGEAIAGLVLANTFLAGSIIVVGESVNIYYNENQVSKVKAILEELQEKVDNESYRLARLQMMYENIE